MFQLAAIATFHTATPKPISLLSFRPPQRQHQAGNDRYTMSGKYLFHSNHGKPTTSRTELHCQLFETVSPPCVQKQHEFGEIRVKYESQRKKTMALVCECITNWMALLSLYYSCHHPLLMKHWTGSTQIIRASGFATEEEGDESVQDNDSFHSMPIARFLQNL